MEYGEVTEGRDEGFTGTSAAEIPDLTVKAEPTPAPARVEEPAVDESMLPSTDDAPRDYREIKEPGQGAPELREMAHIEGHPLIVDY